MTQNLKDKPKKRVCVDFPSIFNNLRLMVTFDWFGIPGSCLGKCGSLKSMPPMDFFFHPQDIGSSARLEEVGRNRTGCHVVAKKPLLEVFAPTGPCCARFKMEL